MVRPEAATCAGPGPLAGRPLLSGPLLDSGCGECGWAGHTCSLPAWQLWPSSRREPCRFSGVSSLGWQMGIGEQLHERNNYRG